MDKKSDMSSETKDEIRAVAEPVTKADVKTFKWPPIQFTAEDGGFCHGLNDAQLTLIYDGSINPAKCKANFTANRVQGGRKGSFNCTIDLKGDNDADITQVHFGNVDMPCRDSSSLSLGPVDVQSGLFGLVKYCVFPAIKETGVKAC